MPDKENTSSDHKNYSNDQYQSEREITSDMVEPRV